MPFPSAGRVCARRLASAPLLSLTLTAAAVSVAPSAMAADEATPPTSASGIPPGTNPDDAPPPEKAPANPPEPPASPYGSIKWDYSPLGVYGPTFTSADQENRVTMGLMVWFDNSFVLDDDELAEALGRDEIDGQSRISSARLEFNGSYTNDYWYYFRIDFQDGGSGSGDANLEWAVLGISDLPVVQNLMVGLQMPLYGLDIWGAYVRHRLMIQPALVNAFFHGPLLGITAYDVDLDHKISWALGVARDTTEEQAEGFQAIDRGEDDFVVHGRFSFMPRYLESGRHMLHLGLSGAMIKPEDETLVWGIWPEVYTDEVDVWPLVLIADAQKSYIGVAEFRLAEGPFWMQSDYFWNRTERKGASDLTFNAFYVEAGYFLTGHQTLFMPLAVSGQVLPQPRTSRKEGAWGAWEVQARYSELDLTSKDLQGGGPPFTQGADVKNYTLGLNWFLNQHIKIGINYVHSVREDLDDASTDIIETRLAWTL